MTRLSRLLVGAAALLLLAVYAFPVRHVRLVAPQYPEGLGMYIHVNTVRGATETDLQNINNLNHYIGMHRIEPDAIPELRYMPWIVGALIIGGALVALAGKRKPLYAWLGAFFALGVVGLADFWRWEYDYGHHLDDATAIIKIPGMSYQPPLIGSKQLLNFTASSWPATAGIAVGLAFLLAACALWLTVRARPQTAPIRAAGAPAATDARAHGRVAVAPTT
jgi:hypothetical protein